MKKLACVMVLALVCAPVFAVVITPPMGYRGTPVEFGVNDLNKALTVIKADVTIRVTMAGGTVSAAAAEAMKALPAKADSFAIARVGKEIAIVGRDRTGAMYGCMELAERLDMNGVSALNIKMPVAQSPAVEFRAVNPFLTLPYKEDDSNWYFLQEDYWTGYLDQLARARINWLDLHGMYDIQTTLFPNIYPYFVVSKQFPEVGPEPAIVERNLNMLNKIIEMAHRRGIKIGLMSYSTSWKGQGMRTAPYEASEENLEAYTREVVRKMIDSCPGLDAIGFRIGESGQKEDFFLRSYVPAIAEAGRPIEVYTRTWLASKDRILPIGREFPGRFMVEIKYNGEQFGPPYIISGGRMLDWYSYSYQDYYSYPRSYQIVYQLRANGTHRVFPWGSPNYAARANECSLLAGSLGLCVEPMDSYYPKYDYRHSDSSPNRWFKWQYQRDWYWYQTWGRTAYAPSLAGRSDVWKRMFAKRFGKEVAGDLYEAMNWASKIVPDAYNSHCYGPDHRHYASELEWGGNVKEWVDGLNSTRKWTKAEPFDKQNIMSFKEYAASLMNNEPSARASLIQMANYLAEEGRKTREYVKSARTKMKNPTPELNDLVTELTALSHLADYYCHKLIGAQLFAVMMASSDVSLEPRIRTELTAAADAWGKLATIGDEHYKPFVDTLRMHTEEYTWSEEGKKLPGDMKALDDAVAQIKASGKTGTAPTVPLGFAKPGPSVLRCDSAVAGSTELSAPKRLAVRVKFAAPDSVGKAFLKTRPMPSETGDWVLSPMIRSGTFFVGEVEVQPVGLMWCIEALDTKGNGTMWPNFRKETPYRYVAPWRPNAESEKRSEIPDNEEG